MFKPKFVTLDSEVGLRLPGNDSSALFKILILRWNELPCMAAYFID